MVKFIRLIRLITYGAVKEGETHNLTHSNIINYQISNIRSEERVTSPIIKLPPKTSNQIPILFPLQVFTPFKTSF